MVSYLFFHSHLPIYQYQLTLPPTALISRRVEKTTTLSDGTVLPKGAQLTFPTMERMLDQEEEIAYLWGRATFGSFGVVTQRRLRCIQPVHLRFCWVKSHFFLCLRHGSHACHGEKGSSQHFHGPFPPIQTEPHTLICLESLHCETPDGDAAGINGA